MLLRCAKSAFTKFVVVSVNNSVCQQWKSFFDIDKHGMKANGQYYWDILLSEKC